MTGWPAMPVVVLIGVIVPFASSATYTVFPSGVIASQYGPPGEFAGPVLMGVAGVPVSRLIGTTSPFSSAT